MQRAAFLRKLESMLEMEPGSLKGDEELETMPNWDSLAHMGFIALVHKDFGARFTGRQLIACKTVNDLLALLGDHLSD